MPTTTSCGLLALRVLLGAVVAVHGIEKIRAAAATDEQETLAFFAQRGFRYPRFTVAFVGYAQAVSGVLLCAGLITAIASTVVAATMANAVIATWRGGFWSQHGGFEYPMFLGAAAVIVAVAGPGSLSADDLLGHSVWAGWPGLLVCCVGIVVSVLVMRSKRLTTHSYG